MAVSEGLVFGGVDLNDGVNYTLRGIAFPVPKKRQEWVQGSDADGAALVRDPLFENRQVPARVRVNPQGTLTMDQALAKFGQLVDLIEESERQPDGTALVWTPAQGTKSLTLYALSGEITDNPIEKATQNSGWFLKAPMVGFTLDCKPFGYGQSVDTITDDFSTNTIANYTFDTGGGTLSVSGGQLVPSDTVLKRIYRSATQTPSSFSDVQATLKFTTGASIAAFDTRVVVRHIDSQNYLFGYVTNGTIQIYKADGGVNTSLVSAAFAPATGTSYWLRTRTEGNLVTAEVWTSAPTATGSPAASVTHTLAGANATKFGAGISGTVGMEMVPGGIDYRYDDFQIEPNLWKSSNPLVIGTVPAIPGDATAEGRVVFTDAAGQPRRHVEFGIEQRYYSPGVPTILDQFGIDTIGSGAWAFDLGAGTIAISAGQLVPSTTVEKRLYRTDSALYTDVRVTTKYTTGASVASPVTGVVAKRIDGSNFLRFVVDSTTVYIQKLDGAALTTLASTAHAAQAATTSYWVRGTVQGNVLTIEHFTADPATGAAAATTLSYTLTGADATKFGQGVAGGCGLDLFPQATDWRYDDFRVCPLAGCTELFLDSECLLTSGYAGTATTRAGAYTGGTVANHVVRGTLVSAVEAIAALPTLGHVGSYRVKARVYCSSTSVQLRLSWQAGDGSFSSNDYVAPVLANTWCEVDLDVVDVQAATLGAQKWSARIEAFSSTVGDTVDVDYFIFEPTEVYGKARSSTASSAGNVVGHDEFTAADGTALSARTAPAGGTWATSGSATAPDFTVSGNAMARTIAANDTAGGRFAILGATSYSDVEVDVDFSMNTNGEFAYFGVIARWVDASNYLIFRWVSGNSAVRRVQLVKVVAGVETELAGAPDFPPGTTLNSLYTLKVKAYASGIVTAQRLAPGGSVDWSFSASDAALATGGTLATGKPGFLHNHQATTLSVTAKFDNFLVSQPAAEPITIYPGRVAEIRYDSAQRQDASGAFYGAVPLYRGARVLLPPAGVAGRVLRLAGKVRRNDVDIAADDQIADAASIQLKYTPRYIAIPR